MKKSTVVFLIIIVMLSVAVLMVFDSAGDGPAFTSANVSRNGASLLFDTLRHMDYAVGVSRSPLSLRTNMDHVYIIIQPFSPPITRAHAEEILEWVQNGGRLIFLHNAYPTVFDTILEVGRDIGGVYWYSVGMGEVVTGRAYQIANGYMMNNPSTGRMIESVLNRWDAEMIWFAEYYHGVSPSENFIDTLPLIVRLVLVQLGLVSFFAVWHLGKRFGRPIPYYEAVEREENEHIRALARLYYKIKKKGRL